MQLDVGPRAVDTVMERVCVLLERERIAGCGWDGGRERDAGEVLEGVGVVIEGCEVGFEGAPLKSPAGGDPDPDPGPDED